MANKERVVARFALPFQKVGVPSFEISKSKYELLNYNYSLKEILDTGWRGRFRRARDQVVYWWKYRVLKKPSPKPPRAVSTDLMRGMAEEMADDWDRKIFEELDAE
jgi:hypothetical protein